MPFVELAGNARPKKLMSVI